MTGWNMPPGCNVSDIPGNRPEDQEAEAFFDLFYDAEEKARKAHGTGDAYVEAMAQWVWEKMGEAWQKGHAQGESDASVAIAESLKSDVDHSPRCDCGHLMETCNHPNCPLGYEPKA